MGDQAVISFVDKDKKTLIKVITGSDAPRAPGFLVDFYKLHFRDEGADLNDLLDLANKHFGYPDRIVVMDRKQTLTGDGKDVKKVDKEYRKTFDDPFWNPRWKHGTADRVMVIMI